MTGLLIVLILTVAMIALGLLIHAQAILLRADRNYILSCEELIQAQKDLIATDNKLIDSLKFLKEEYKGQTVRFAERAKLTLAQTIAV